MVLRDFLDGRPHGRLIAENAPVGDKSNASFRREKNHAEMVAQAGARRRIRVRTELLLLLPALLFDIREDLRQHMHNALPRWSGRVRENEPGYLLRMRGGVGHRKESAVGVANQRDLLESELLAHGFKVGDLSVHR